NNLIANLDVTGATGATMVSGIRGAAGSALYLFYNTIYLNATSNTTTNFGTSGIFISGTTSPVLDIRNNIVINNSTPKGTGRTAAFRRSSTNNSAILASTNNNLYYAGVPSANNVIYFDGTNNYQSISDYRNLIAPREDFSVTENTAFISTVGSSVDFLKIDPAIASIAESGAQTLTGYTSDYFTNNIRTGYPLAGQVNGGGAAPDMGAIEGDYTPRIIVDYGIAEFLSPEPGNCYTANSDIIVEIQNYSISTIDIADHNVTVNVTATDPANVVTPFSIVVNSGILMPGETMPVNISSTYDMSATGTYTFTATTYSIDDIDTSNDSLNPAYTFTIATGNVSVNNNSVCSGSAIQLTINGSSGTIQWQNSTDNGATWVNSTGAGSTLTTFNDTVPNTDVLYRAITCGTLISDTVAVAVTFVAPPTSSNVTRCGTGPVTLNATATSGIVSWYDAATGGSLLQTGNTYTPTVSSSTTFYAQATDGGSGSDSLTTTFAGGSGCDFGNMFDITAISSVDVSGFTVVPNVTSANHVVNVYYKTGTYVGSINTPGAWTLAGTVTLNATVGVPVKFNLSTPFALSAGQTYGIYVEHNAQYTVGANTYSNADISVTTGDGLCASFTFCCNPRSFNGRIHYSSGCASSRTPVSVTVDPAPAITLTASLTEICENDTTLLA
ncbi:MAG: hypothetical protein H0X62_17830, partial [Bacteroidetes bacterium]|nr:hypothetical protein [Bacteroidota bacterium]